MKKNKTIEIILIILILITFQLRILGQTKNNNNTYSVTIRLDDKDSTFQIKTKETKEKYNTVLWVTDYECTECKDCYVDSGDIKTPEILKQYIRNDEMAWGKDIFLSCINPYNINTAYNSFKIYGHVEGVKYGYIVFCIEKFIKLD